MKDSPQFASAEKRLNARKLLAEHINTISSLVDPNSATLHPDPCIRQHYLSVLCHFSSHLDEDTSDFSLRLIMQQFATLRYDPSILPVELQTSSSDCSVKLRSSAVKRMHLSTASNILKLVRSSPQKFLPFFDSFCCELGNIWSSRSCGLTEQCLLIEAIVILALHLPCGFEDQRIKFGMMPAEIFSDWTQSDSCLFKLSNYDAPGLVQYFGLDQDVDLVRSNVAFVQERIKVRLDVQRVVTATTSAVRCLRQPLSCDQLRSVCIPLIEPIILPAFRFLKTMNELWRSTTLNLIHPTMHRAVDVKDNEKRLLMGLHTINSKEGLPPESDFVVKAVTHDYTRILQNFFATVNENLLILIHLIIEATSPCFYALPSEQLSGLMCNFISAGLELLPDYRLLCISRHVISPYIRLCPAANIESALIPIIPFILDSFFQKVNTSWSVFTLINKDDVDEQEVSDEVFVEETLRSLSNGLVELVRLFLSFNGSKPMKFSESVKEDEIVETPVSCNGDDEMEEVDDGEGRQPPVKNLELGLVTTALLGTHFETSFDSSGTMEANRETTVFDCDNQLAHIVSWLAIAITWPDSRVCHKAATLLLKIIDFVFKQERKPTHQIQLSTDLTCQLFIGGLHALRTNGQFQNDCCVPLLTLLSRVYSSAGQTTARSHLEPIIVTALNSCRANPDENQLDLNNVHNFTSAVFQSNTPPSERSQRQHLCKLLRAIIGIPISEQFREHLSLTHLEPLKRPSMRMKAKLNREHKPEIALQALADLFSPD